MSRVLWAMVAVVGAGCVGGRAYVRPGVMASIHRVSLKMTTGGSAVSAGETALGGRGIVTGGQYAMGAEDQAEIARGQMEDALTREGLVVTDTPPVDALAEFAVATIRFHPLGGWIADRARLVLRSTTDGAILATFESDAGGSSVISPAVLIDKIGAALHAAIVPPPPVAPPRPDTPNEQRRRKGWD